MTDPKDPNNPPIPVPETMEEFREMARKAMAVAAETAADLKKDREARKEERRQDREAWRELEKTMREIGITAGRHAENSGRILEEAVAEQVRRDGKIAWMRADEIHPNVVHNEGPARGECDLFVVNGGEAMAVEVKRVLRAEDVRKFSEMLPRLREFFPRLVKDRVLYGAMAFALEEKKEEVRDSVRKMAVDAGILLIRVAGKSGLKIVNPDREKLRAVEA